MREATVVEYLRPLHLSERDLGRRVAARSSLEKHNTHRRLAPTRHRRMAPTSFRVRNPDPDLIRTPDRRRQLPTPCRVVREMTFLPIVTGEMR